MSHFTVMVFGENPKAQLEPYSEDREVAPYVTEAVTQEEKQRFMEYYLRKGDILPKTTFEEAYVQYGEDWNGNSWWKEEDDILYDHSTYPVGAKWDWYSLGGRWTGYFKVKEGAYANLGEPGAFDNQPRLGWADQLFKRDIDIEEMRISAARDAAIEYDKFHAVLSGREYPDWETIREKWGKDGIEQARKEYHENQVVQDLRRVGFFFMGNEDQKFLESRADFLQAAQNCALVPFAVVKDGKWYEKGEMGWWGMVSNEQDQDEWNKKFQELFDSLPEDILVSLFDCHI